VSRLDTKSFRAAVVTWLDLQSTAASLAHRLATVLCQPTGKECVYNIL